MKKYCTLNKGNRKTCSLVNHGRDCENKKITTEDNQYSQFYSSGTEARLFPPLYIVYSEVEVNAAISLALLENGVRLS